MVQWHEIQAAGAGLNGEKPCSFTVRRSRRVTPACSGSLDVHLEMGCGCAYRTDSPLTLCSSQAREDLVKGFAQAWLSLPEREAEDKLLLSWFPDSVAHGSRGALIGFYFLIDLCSHDPPDTEFEGSYCGHHDHPPF